MATSNLIDIKLRTSFDKGAMNTATREVGRSMQTMSSRVKIAATEVNKVIATSAIPLGAALGGAFAFGTAAAVKFEEEFANVKKTLDVSAEGEEAERIFNNIAQQLRDIAKFSPAGISELSQIAAVGGQLGIAATDIVSFTDTIQKLTVATNLSAEQAAMSLARLQKITNLASADIDNLASVLVKLGNNFATTESEIITAATQIATATAGISTQFNNSATDALAFATALRAVGQPAQAGATAIIRLVQVISRFVDSGGEELADIADTADLTTEAFQELFAIDPGRALALFIEGLGQAEKDGKDALAVLDALGLGQIRTTRALMALGRAEGEGGIGLVSEALNMANEEFVVNNALLTESERRYSTTISQLKILKNIVQEAGISYGSQFLPAINNVIKGFTSMINSMTDLNKTLEIIGKTSGVISLLLAPLAILGRTFKAITADTTASATAVALLRKEITMLNAAQMSSLFDETAVSKLGLLLANPGATKLGSIKNLIRRPRGGINTSQVTRPFQVDSPAGFRGPFPVPAGTESFGTGGGGFVGPFPIPGPEGQITQIKTTKRLSGAFHDTKRALGLLSKQAGVGRIRFLRMNGAFSDSKKFMDALNLSVQSFNGTGKMAIKMSRNLQIGFIGLAQATQAVAAAIKGLALTIGRIVAPLLVFAGIFKIFERIGARRRSMDEFAQGIGEITGSIVDLERERVNLQELQEFKLELIDQDASDAAIKSVEGLIETTTRGIASLESQIRTTAGEDIMNLVFAQDPGIKGRFKNLAESTGLDKTSLQNQIFGGLSGIVTDIQTGKSPTVGNLVEAIAETTFGDAGIDKGIRKLAEEGNLLEAIQKGSSRGFEVDGASRKDLNDFLKIYQDIFEIATDEKLDNLTLDSAFDNSSKILEAKAQFLNRQQELLIAEGKMSQAEFLDATKEENFQEAFSKVQKIIVEDIERTANAADDAKENIEDLEAETVRLSKTIEDNLEQAVNSAINSLEKLPEAARMSATEFMSNLTENLQRTKAFEEGIDNLFNIAPLLAKQLSQQGVVAEEVLAGFLANPAAASQLEKQLQQVVGPELAKQSADSIKQNASQFEEAGEAFTDALINSFEDKEDEIAEAFVKPIDSAVEKILEKYGIDSPSQWMYDNVGVPMAQGVIDGYVSLEEDMERAFVSSIIAGIERLQEDFGIYTAATDAARNVTRANKAQLESEIALNAERRRAASFSDRFAKNQKELIKLEQEGRAGVITLDEEIGLLRQKISLEDKVRKAGGNKSARELLAIQKAEENITDLRAMQSKGVISNLELQAAEERLAEMKGEDITEDERKLMILELAQAEKNLNEATAKALEIDDRLVKVREENFALRDESITQADRLKIAEDNVAAAKEKVIEADHKYDMARAKFVEETQYNSEFMNNLLAIQEEYGNLGLEIDTTAEKLASLPEVMRLATTGVLHEIAKTLSGFETMTMYIATLTGFMGSSEFRTFSEELNRQQAAGNDLSQGIGRKNPPFAHQTSGFSMLPSYIQEAYRRVDENILSQLPDYMKYGMGGRVKGYKYGGRGDPMTRALVGEYGPEEVRFIPGNGFLVKPLGTGSSGTMVNNLNVNVTGVPSDPINARKAAVQISKALKKLDKEGSSGTGLRRN